MTGDKLVFFQARGVMRPTSYVSAVKANRPNFVIQWNGHDWSGFRTLAECQKQFSEIEAR